MTLQRLADPDLFALEPWPAAEPILAWAGGKRRLAADIAQHLPPAYKRYFEPFAGGAALFFALRPRMAFLGDANPELINVYCAVRDDWRAVERILRSFEDDESSFLELRAKRHTSLEPAFAAARTIHLNRTCFNGLYRVNREGHFNTSYGHKRRTFMPGPGEFHAAADALANASLHCGDYRETLAQAEEGDVVFLDPPYLPKPGNVELPRYTADSFDEQAHQELCDVAERLGGRGCHTLVTLPNHPLMRDLYGAHHIEILHTPHTIGGSRIAGARAATELLVAIERDSSA